MGGDILDLLVKWALVQYETLKYIEGRSRTPRKFVTAEELSEDIGISFSAAKTRLSRYEKKNWVKKIDAGGDIKAYVLIFSGLKRYSWLRVLVETAIAEGLLSPNLVNKAAEPKKPEPKVLQEDKEFDLMSMEEPEIMKRPSSVPEAVSETDEAEEGEEGENIFDKPEGEAELESGISDAELPTLEDDEELSPAENVFDKDMSGEEKKPDEEKQNDFA
ncbi:MAG: hypothetical protein ABIH42_01630 [Planctomycetota bacterium]